jgi:hypothetical protein
MAPIDACYLEDVSAGSHLIVDYLAGEGIEIGRDRMRHILRRTDLQAAYQQSRTITPCDPAKRFPCLQREAELFTWSVLNEQVI